MGADVDGDGCNWGQSKAFVKSSLTEHKIVRY